MTNHIDLAQEFPELKETIHEKKIHDAHFRRLYDQYAELNQSVYRAEKRIDLLSEEGEESLRKERVHLKDELYAMLTKPAA